MTELDTLYQKNILALAKIGASGICLASPQFSAMVKNPVCGDQVQIDISFLNDQTMIGAEVRGCVLCEAATGLILSNAQIISKDQAKELKTDIDDWLTGNSDLIPLDQLDIFVPVKAFHSRIECVLLPFKALAKCIQ